MTIVSFFVVIIGFVSQTAHPANFCTTVGRCTALTQNHPTGYETCESLGLRYADDTSLDLTCRTGEVCCVSDPAPMRDGVYRSSVGDPDTELHFYSQHGVVTSFSCSEQGTFSTYTCSGNACLQDSPYPEKISVNLYPPNAADFISPNGANHDMRRWVSKTGLP